MLPGSSPGENLQHSYKLLKSEIKTYQRATTCSAHRRGITLKKNQNSGGAQKRSFPFGTKSPVLHSDRAVVLLADRYVQLHI